jgi:perosamine synthetase
MVNLSNGNIKHIKWSFGDNMNNLIPIYKPFLTSQSLKYAHDAIESSWISSSGKYIEIATDTLKDILNVGNVLLTNNGTSANHLAVRSLLFKNKNVKRIIVPNNVYVAAWNPILYEGLILDPIETCIDTWNIDLNKLPDKLPEDTAILIVHNVGNIINVPELIKKYGKDKIIEDNCEGFLGRYGRFMSGTKSLSSSISFFANKNITSGEGGALITNDDDIYENALIEHGQGQKKGTRYIHDRLGYNYRMTNVQAAILLGQLESIDEIMLLKNKVFERYRLGLEGEESIVFQKIENDTMHSNWMFSLRIIGMKCYDEIRDYLFKNGIETRPVFYPMSIHSHLSEFSNNEGEINANIISKESFMVPSFPELKNKEIDYITEKIKEFIADNKCNFHDYEKSLRL